MKDTFFGETAEYWHGLKRQIEERGLDDLMGELIIANAKVQYYEKKLAEMQRFKEAAEL